MVFSFELEGDRFCTAIGPVQKDNWYHFETSFYINSINGEFFVDGTKLKLLDKSVEKAD